jgi:hypothetical protein
MVCLLITKPARFGGKEALMTTFKAFGLATLLLLLTFSLSFAQETVKDPATEIVRVGTETATI